MMENDDDSGDDAEFTSVPMSAPLAVVTSSTVTGRSTSVLMSVSNDFESRKIEISPQYARLQRMSLNELTARMERMQIEMINKSRELMDTLQRKEYFHAKQRALQQIGSRLDQARNGTKGTYSVVY